MFPFVTQHTAAELRRTRAAQRAAVSDFQNAVSDAKQIINNTMTFERNSKLDLLRDHTLVLADWRLWVDLNHNVSKFTRHDERLRDWLIAYDSYRQSTLLCRAVATLNRASALIVAMRNRATASAGFLQ